MYGTAGSHQVFIDCCEYFTIGSWFLCSYLYHGLGVTLGYHRLLAHRSLAMPKWVVYPMVSGGYLALQGSPVVWVGVHRLHHQKSDARGDPHAPRDGFMHALVGWMFTMYRLQTKKELQTQAADVMQDRLYNWLGNSHTLDHVIKCLLISVAFRIGILYAFGLSAMAANLVAAFLIFWNAQLVNAACHIKTAGTYRNFATKDSSFNLWWLGILALGEGWHNNHHAMPASARHGWGWGEIDLTWYVIWLLEKMGVARNVCRHHHSQNLRAY
jgi:fatty-acid desaturase